MSFLRTWDEGGFLAERTGLQKENPGFVAPGIPIAAERKVILYDLYREVRPKHLGDHGYDPPLEQA